LIHARRLTCGGAVDEYIRALWLGNAILAAAKVAGYRWVEDYRKGSD